MNGFERAIAVASTKLSLWRTRQVTTRLALRAKPTDSAWSAVYHANRRVLAYDSALFCLMTAAATAAALRLGAEVMAARGSR